MGLQEYGNTAVWVDDTMIDASSFVAMAWHVRRDPDGRDVYAWAVLDDDRAVIAHDRDHDYVRTGCQGGDARGALSALFSFLGADAEAYSSRMGASQPDDGYLFGEDVAEWAYGVADELAIAGIELDEDDDA